MTKKSVLHWRSTCLGICLGLLLFLLSAGLYSKSEKEVPPVKKQVILEKILRITDEGDEDFYFKYPMGIYADAEDNIYLLDNQRLLKFSKTGRYIGNLTQRGQGPGEINYISNLYISGDKIIIHSNRPSKIIRKDLGGALINEFRVEKLEWNHFIHCYNDQYYFFNDEDLPNRGNSNGRIVDIDYIFFAVSADGKSRIDIRSFPVTVFAVYSEEGGGWAPIGDLNYAIWEGRYLFISHTIKYNLKCLDLREKKVINEFGIKYTPQEIPGDLIKRFNPGKFNINGIEYTLPPRKYFNDIRKLLIHNRHLWVITSMVDQTKGVRVDRYNFPGEYIDSFYLLLPGHVDMYDFDWYIYGGYLYAIERSDRGDISILKYAIRL